MIRRISRPAIRWLTAAFGVFLLAAVASGQDMEQQLEQVTADWGRRLQRIQRIRYRVTGEGSMPREQLTDDFGKPIPIGGGPNIKAPFQWTWLLDFRTNRHRLEKLEQAYSLTEKRFIRYAEVNTFDGKSRWGARRREPDDGSSSEFSSLSVSTGDLRGNRITSDMFPVFFGHGIVPFSGAGRLYPGHLTVPPTTEALTIHGQVVHEGRVCLVLRTPASQGIDMTYEELWVDPSRDSAVVRHAYYTNATPRIDRFIWYRETTHGWLLERWESTHRSSQKLLERSQARVETLEIDPIVSDTDFRLEEKPGMLVKTSVRPPWDEQQSEVPPEATNRRYFRIDEQGNRREVDFKDGVEQPIRRAHWPWVLLTVSVIALLAATATVVKRRRPRPSA